jgi:hypothetical protein
LANVYCFLCHKNTRATKTRLESTKEAYSIQWAYHGKCRYCKQDFIFWQGEDRKNGSFTPMFEVPKEKASEWNSWKRRIETGEFKPEPQFVSQYTQTIASGNMDAIGAYQTKLCKAHQWYKGKRIDNSHRENQRLEEFDTQAS